MTEWMSDVVSWIFMAIFVPGLLVLTVLGCVVLAIRDFRRGMRGERVPSVVEDIQHALHVLGGGDRSRKK